MSSSKLTLGTAFSPNDVYGALYRDSMRECAEQLQIDSLSAEIQQWFAQLTPQPSEIKQDYALAHLAKLKGHSEFRDLYSDDTCSFCILQLPHHALDCGHRLCEACVMKHGEASRWGYHEIASCPLCDRSNSRLMLLMPPTAGIRTLQLGGMGAEDTLGFLQQLQKSVGLTMMPLRHHFDRVTGTDAGKLLHPVLGGHYSKS